MVFQESCVQTEFIILHPGGGPQFLKNNSKIYCYVYSLRRNQDIAPSLHYYLLTAFSLFLHFLISLMGNCLNLLLET